MPVQPADSAPVVRDPRSVVACGGADSEQPRTWSDLLVLTERLRRAVAERGYRQVVLFSNDRFFMLASFLACWAEGAVAVLPPNARPEAIRRLISSGAADGLLSDSPEHSEFSPAGDEASSTSTSPRTSGFDFATSARRVGAVLAGRGDDHLVTVHSSGSTGMPVGFRKTARQLLGEAETLGRTFGLHGDLASPTCVLSTAPAHHIYGLLFGVLAPFLAGGAFVRQTVFHSQSIAQLVRQLRATVLCAVPAHLHGLQTLAPGGLAGLRRVICSGAPLSAAVAEMVTERFGVPVTEIFGSTETGGIAWRVVPGDGDWQPLPGVSVTVGADGVLLVDSPFVDRRSGVPFRASDRVALVGHGRFRHLGRVDAIIKIGGERVSVAEIERRLLAVDGVNDAAIFVREAPAPRHHELQAAVVAPGISPAALRGALLRSLEPVAIPRRFLMVERLPREATGKLPQASLAALFNEVERSSPAAPAAPAAPADGTP